MIVQNLLLVAASSLYKVKVVLMKLQMVKDWKHRLFGIYSSYNYAHVAQFPTAENMAVGG